MISDRLAIPLNSNPARQKLWRAVGFLGLALGAIVLGYVIDRMIHFRSLPQRWPAEANLELRLIKTPRTIRLVEEGFAGVQALPGTPWDISDALAWSKREFILYSDGESVIGMVIDGKMPEETLASLQTWGWSSVAVGRRTLVIREDSAEPAAARRHMNFWLTLPVFDGSVTIKDSTGHASGLPFRFSSATSLDFRVNMGSFTPATKLSLPIGTKLLGSFALPEDLSGAFLPSSVPATFPGLQLLSRQAKQAPIDVLLGNDTLGPAFVLAMPTAGLTLEELGAIATEGASLQDLSTTALTTEGLSTSTEIRSSANIDVNLNNENGLLVAIAQNPAGQTFRLTQSGTQLIVSNRSTNIGLELAEYSGSCLRKPAGFLAPSTLSTTMPSLNFSQGYHIINHLLQADEIAYRKNWLRICW